jgi:hypothetical protein
LHFFSDVSSELADESAEAINCSLLHIARTGVSPETKSSQKYFA